MVNISLEKPGPWARMGPRYNSAQEDLMGDKSPKSTAKANKQKVKAKTKADADKK